MASTEQFSAAKKRLLERFLRGEVARQNFELPVPVREPGQSTPLAPGQQHLMLHAQMAPDSPLYNESVTLYFRGRLDRSAFERAYQEFVRRHEVWRTGFATAENQTMQAVYDDFRVQIPFLDLTHLPEDQREPEMLRVATADVQRAVDLAVGPFVRPKLFRLAEEDYRLHVMVHHLVHDGIAMAEVFVPEITALYKAFSEDLPSPLPEPRLQYGDYAVWQKRLIDNDSDARQMEFWRRELAGELPTLDLPTDRSRPPIPSYSGATERFQFSPEMTHSLKQLSRTEGVTFYMLLLAAFQTLLHRYSGKEDIVVGTVADGRRRPEFKSLMGYFLNTLPVRTRPAAAMSFRDYLTATKNAVLGSLGNSDVLFERLVREIQPRRDFSRHPLFQVMFLMPPAAQGSSDDSPWELKEGEAHSGTCKFDLYFDVEDRPEGLVGRLQYSTDLFDAITIRRMIGHWTTLLEGILRDPGARLQDLPLLTTDERHLLTSAWNSTQLDIPHAPAHELFEEQAARTPNAVAVESDERSLTYRELNQASNRLAHRLIHLGAGPDVLVALCAERSCDMVVALLAILKSGAAYLPLDPALPPDRLSFLLDDAQAPILVTERGLADRFPSHSAKVAYCDDDITGESNSNPGRIAQPEGLAYVLYTSGSTGKPKGVEIPHSALVNFLESMRREPGFAAGDTLLSVTTLSFDIAALEIFLPLITGGRLIVASREDARDPDRLLELMRRVSPSVMQATPATWRALIDAGWTGSPTLKLLCGGEAMPRDLAQHLLRRCRELWNMYGPTETTIWSTLQKVTDDGGAVRIGHPIANTQIYVLDCGGNLVPPGVVGDLYIGGAGLARGYRGRPELTRERFLNMEAAGGAKLYWTGDLARWHRDGSLECLGRADNQVKIRGFRVELEEIESALLTHPDVRAAAVKAWPDASGSMSLAGYIVASGQPDLRAYLNGRLPEYMVPSRMVRLDALPLTPNGKVDRKQLAHPGAEEQRAAIAPARSETENRMVALWESVLDQSPIGIRDNFFELGGHSLLVAKLLRRIEAEFGHRLSMADVFQAPTIELLSELLGDWENLRKKPRVIRRLNPGSRPPLFWMNAGAIYHKLAARLNEKHPFISVALAPEEVARLADPPQVEEMAAHLVRTIQEMQPEGPYYLGGRCASGMLTYEAAQQLTAAGHEVALVILLDALNPEHFLTISPRRLLASRLRHHWRKLTGLPDREALVYALDRVSALADRLRPAEPEEASNAKLYSAVRRYCPKPYSGRLVQLGACDRLDVTRLEESWAELACANWEFFQVPGDHETTLRDPNTPELAARIARCMEQAEQQRRAPFKLAARS